MIASARSKVSFVSPSCTKRKEQSAPTRICRLTYCPNCGSHLKQFRRGYVELFNLLQIKTQLPPRHACLCCGFDMRRVKIAEPTR